VPRYCFTNWLSQSRGRGGPVRAAAPAPAPPPPGDRAEARRFLLSPPVRRHLVKILYAEEWEASLAESHPGGAATDAALELHRDGVARARQALAPYEAEIAALAAECAGGGADARAAGLRWL
jgi:hypothetical protein